MFDYARGGPQWGACVLIIEPPQAPGMGGMSGPDSPTSDGRRGRPAAKSTSNGQAYETVPDEYADCSSFGGSAVEAKLREVQVGLPSHPLSLQVYTAVNTGHNDRQRDQSKL